MTRVKTPQGIFNYRGGHVDHREPTDSGAENGAVGGNGAAERSDAEAAPSWREIVGSCGNPVPHDVFVQAVNGAWAEGYKEGWEAALNDVRKWAEGH